MRNRGVGSWCYRTDTALAASIDILGEGPYGALLRVLEESRRLGFLGPGPVGRHIDRALDLLPLIPIGARSALDLGSGGGVPGLPLVLACPTLDWVLLDGSATRTRFLRDAAEQLVGAGSGRRSPARVRVVEERAEVAGRWTDLRAAFDLVVARSFGPPAVTAECGAPFLSAGGRMVVAEPPDQEPRWPVDGLAQLGLAPGRRVTEPSAFQVLEQVAPCPDRYPRRVGIPAKRPLF